MDDTLLNDALAALRRGEAQAAEKPLRRLLRRQPGHVAALNILTVTLSQLQRHAEAENCIRAVLKLQPPTATVLYNYGLILKAQNRPAEALAQFAQALTLDAGSAEIWNGQGAVLNDLKRFDEAIASFDRALRINPSYPEAAFNKANSLLALRRFAEALALYDPLLRALPQWPEAWIGRATALWRLDHPAARGAFEQALRLNPQSRNALIGLGRVLLEAREANAAFTQAQHALALQDTPEARALTAACLQSPWLDAGTPQLAPVLMRALTEVWTRPSTLAPICARYLLADSTRLLADPLAVAALETMPVSTPALEAFVTEQRRALLTAAIAPADAAPERLRLFRAVAMQAFLTAYALAKTPAETVEYATLREQVRAALAQRKQPISDLQLLALAAYAPLSTLDAADAILARQWGELLAPVLDQQLRAWREEQTIRGDLALLTPIDGAVSQAVRSQYEESPYPHWVQLETAPPTDLSTLLRDLFPDAAGLAMPPAPHILIAGCGTGRSSIQLALQLPQAQILAIDLSLTSLSYATRQARRHRAGNVDYAQADIMQLGTLDRRFDMIESGGVLHHLADPFAGWRVLLGLLRPGGVMRLGFYSELARQEIVAGRALIASRGYAASTSDIRRLRQDVFALPEDDPLKKLTQMSDFYNLSDCRDLLFHVQEHRLTLPEIADFLAANSLVFLGFELEHPVKRRYARQFPADQAMTDLALWHRFETENPYTFGEMYQFWVQKRP